MASKSAKKRTPAKKSVSAKSSTQSARASSAKSTAYDSKTPDNSQALKVKKQYVVLFVILVLIAFLAFKNRGLFVAAVVNGKPISRLDVVKEAEKQSGKQTINNLVRNSLIEQEAKKQKVTVSEKEINEEIKKVDANLSKQGQKLDQVLATQGINREDLRRLIRLDKLVGKMVGKDIKISDKEIADYIEKNKESLPQDQSEEQLKKTVSSQLKQQALSAKVQSWLAGLQSKAKIQYFVQY